MYVKCDGIYRGGDRSNENQAMCKNYDFENLMKLLKAICDFCRFEKAFRLKFVYALILY